MSVRHAAKATLESTSSPRQRPTDHAARQSFGDIAPALAEITDKVLFGDIWERPGLSPRDRSLVTITSLISLYRTNELPFHLKKALEHGMTTATRSSRRLRTSPSTRAGRRP